MISKNLSEILSQSTAYGLPKIFQTQRIFFKFYWLIFFIGGSCVSIWQIINIVNSYYEYTVVTKIETKYQQPTPFPTISFCPGVEKAFDNDSFEYFLHECIDTKRRDCKKNSSLYFISFKTWRGTCFRLNSGKDMNEKSVPIINSTIGGRDDGFRLTFNTNSSIHIWVHEPLSPPIFAYFQNFIGDENLIESNTFAYLGIEKSIETKLGLPYNNCYKDVKQFPYNKKLIDFIDSTNKIYKQTLCLEYCFEEHYLTDNECKCTNASLGNVWKNCYGRNDTNSSSCTLNYKSNFFEKSVVDYCKEYCPLECDTVTFTSTVNQIRNTYGEKFQLQLWIFYKTLKYTSLTQYPKTDEFDLISNIGGILGLFIGCSFASFFELFEIVIEVIFIVFQKNKKPMEQIQANPNQSIVE